MRPRPQDGKQKREVDPKLAGRDFWKGWCCDRCGMANERWSWKGWECEGCQQRYRVMRRVWRAADLWPTTRPIPTGPRMEEGHAMFPWNETTRSSIVWEDGLKVILHGLAEGTEIHHALAHNGHDFNKDANLSFMGLQGQGVNEVGFLRVAAFGRHVRREWCAWGLRHSLCSLYQPSVRVHVLPLLYICLRPTGDSAHPGYTDCQGHIVERCAAHLLLYYSSDKHPGWSDNRWRERVSGGGYGCACSELTGFFTGSTRHCF